MIAQEICRQATHQGLRLEPRGDKLSVTPRDLLTPDFADILREHKAELLDWLNIRAVHVPRDCDPWLHVARQILAGEFDDLLDNSVRGSLETGLRSIIHPVCQRALERLRDRSKNTP
jgi:hypothetical protein